MNYPSRRAGPLSGARSLICRLLARHQREASSNPSYVQALARGLLEVLSAGTFVDAVFGIAATIAAVYKAIRSRVHTSRSWEPHYSDWD